MKKQLLLIALTICFVGIMNAQTDKDAVLMTLENEEISLGDFEYIFKKNNTDTEISKADLDEYIELFVNYKLKVKAAKDAKLDTNKAFIAELKGYRKQLARPYLTDSDLLDLLTKEAYNRKKREIHARHILAKVDADAEPADTLKAWNKIKSLKNRIEVDGEDFVTVAKSKNGSDDPSAKDNGGDLGFFSAFQMVYPFEEAAYNTPVGSISNIIRTRYGYHILEVVESRDARGEILVAHIMTKAGNISDAKTQQRAQEKIQEIYVKHQNGEKFEDLARKYSEDASTAKTGGELPWFGTRKMVKSFEDISFNLENAGDVSVPFQTEYGWHIIKKLDEKVIGDYESLKGEIKNKVGKDSRAEVTKSSFLNKLKKEYTIKEKSKLLKLFYPTEDSIFFAKDWNYENTKKLSKTALKIEDEKYSYAEFVKFMKTKKRRANTDDSKAFISDTYSKWTDKKLLDYEDGKLESKHEPFRLLMQEYKDGILLFELTDQLVWSKAIKDTTGLQEYFGSHRPNYMWPERFMVEAFESNSSEVSSQIMDMMKNGLSNDTILKTVTETSELNANLESGLFSRTEKKYLEEFEVSERGIFPISEGGKHFVVKIVNGIPAKQKELSEAKGLITSDYQSFLEQDWIQSLKSKYNYTVNKDVLYSLTND